LDVGGKLGDIVLSVLGNGITNSDDGFIGYVGRLSITLISRHVLESFPIFILETEAFIFSGGSTVINRN